MIVKRIITGLVIAIFAFLVTLAGEPWFTLTICAISAIATFEFFRMIKNYKIQPLYIPGIAFSLLFVLNSFYVVYLSNNTINTTHIIITCITVIPLCYIIFLNNRDYNFNNWSWTLAGILYIGFLLSFYPMLRSLDNGAGWVILIISSTASGDVFAYLIGSNFGKHKLAEHISPGKTWEGAVGGVFGSLFACFVFSNLFGLPLSILQIIIAGLIISVFSQLGDLVESLLKRTMEVKDSGKLLPGHGGMLDRIDSHLLIAPVAYYLITLSINQGWII